MARRTAEGKTKKEVIRCLKRYVAARSTTPSSATWPARPNRQRRSTTPEKLLVG
jgi:hypothetical protein